MRPFVPDVTRLKQRVYHSYMKYASYAAMDCLYDFDETSTVTNYVVEKITKVTFSIVQYNCSSQFNRSLGGSSIDVKAEFGAYTTICAVHDLFTNHYTVTCSLPAYYANESKLCINITAILDYEHFDAFSDTSESFLKQGIYLENKKVICAMSYKREELNIAESKLAGWIRIDEPLDYGPAAGKRWSGANTRFPSTSVIKKCASDQKIIFVGSSHQRYHWDYAAYLYFDKAFLLKTLRKHPGDVEIENMKYVSAVFARDIADYIKNIILPLCMKGLEKITVIFMTGSWDLTFPPRRFIRSPKNGMSIIEAITKMKVVNCSNVNLVWASTVAHERQDDRLKNSYAIDAAMEWLHRKLVEIKYQNFQFIDLFRLSNLHIYGKESEGDLVCDSHFLCHSDNYNGIYQTSTGYAALALLLRAACNQYLGPETSDNPNNENQSIYLSNKIVRDESSGQHFLIQYDLRRAITDNETLDVLMRRYKNKYIEKMPLSIINEYAVDMPMFSLRDYKVYITREFVHRDSPTHKFWVIHNGNRRYVHGWPALTSFLNATVQSIELQRISYFDLLSIPLGIPIVSAK